MKFMKTRLEIIQNRKKAEQKLMKSDIAELLKSGLDYDAYIRVRFSLQFLNFADVYSITHFIISLDGSLSMKDVI